MTTDIVSGLSIPNSKVMRFTCRERQHSENSKPQQQRDELRRTTNQVLTTPIPAAISLMLSTHGQRLGDRIVDTIVVNAGSIRELPSGSLGGF